MGPGHLERYPGLMATTGVTMVSPVHINDRDRAGLMADSFRRCAPDGSQLILLCDARDRASFASYASDRVTVRAIEEVLPSWLKRAPTHKGIWLSAKSLPVRGWIVQQIAKLNAFTLVDASENLVVLCDSDVSFVRPFARQEFFDGDKVRCLDVSWWNDWYRDWTQIAADMTGISYDTIAPRNHIGSLIAFDRSTMAQLRSRVEATVGHSMEVDICRRKNFSEYQLYGVFVRAVVGYENSAHSPSDVAIVKNSWDDALTDPAALESFMTSFDPTEFAVMVHSKMAVPVERIRELVQRQWVRHGVGG
jgi:hypothetical protein